VPLFEQRPNVHLVIAGSGEPVFQEITQLVKNLGLQGRIHLLGRREDMSNVMAGFDLFCLMTRLEASGMVFLEAASAGLPVIGSAVGGVPEMMEAGKTGLLVKLDDDEGLHRALLTLIDDPVLRKKMGQAGFDRIWQDPTSPFTPQSLVRQTEASYRKWLSGRRARTPVA